MIFMRLKAFSFLLWLFKDHPHLEMTVKTMSWFMNFFSIAPIISFVLFLPTYSILGDWALSLSLTQFFWVANPGLSETEGAGGLLTDQLIISLPGHRGENCAHHITTLPPDFQTFLWPCETCLFPMAGFLLQFSG
jgi:hypothetical protein